MTFALQTLLDLRTQAEKAAEENLASAVANTARARKTQADLDAAILAADEKRRAETTRLQMDGGAVSAIAGTQAYLKRLAFAVETARETADKHRQGPLAEALAAETEARARLTHARTEREALEKHKAKLEAQARLEAERKAEDAAGDLALALRARKHNG